MGSAMRTSVTRWGLVGSGCLSGAGGSGGRTGMLRAPSPRTAPRTGLPLASPDPGNAPATKGPVGSGVSASLRMTTRFGTVTGVVNAWVTREGALVRGSTRVSTGFARPTGAGGAASEIDRAMSGRDLGQMSGAINIQPSSIAWPPIPRAVAHTLFVLGPLESVAVSNMSFLLRNRADTRLLTT